MNILLAEDESTISQLIKHVLGACGHEVTGVRRVEEAKNELEHSDFDLVLLDSDLADGDGQALLETLGRHGRRRPPVVLMSGERYFAHEDELAMRADAVLWKPFELVELEQSVNRFIA